MFARRRRVEFEEKGVRRFVGSCAETVMLWSEIMWELQVCCCLKTAGA